MAADQNPSLGEYLRHEREKRGITIEQVASATKISVRLLHSIEADNYAELPAKPFIRGFVNSYARFIGLDSKEILTRFDAFLDQKVCDRPTRDAGHSGYAFEKREGEQSRTVLWIVMGSFIVLGGLLFIFLKPSLHHHQKNQIDKLRETHPESSPVPEMSSVPRAAPSTAASGVPVLVLNVPSSIPEALPSASASAVPEPLATPSLVRSADRLNSGVDLLKTEIKYKVALKALDDVWVRYRVDEKPMMKFILRKDKVLILRAQALIRLQVSDPSQVSYNFNGKGTKTVADAKNIAVHHGSSTLVFPMQSIENTQDPFPGEKALPTEVPSSPRDASANSPAAP